MKPKMETPGKTRPWIKVERADGWNSYKLSRCCSQLDDDRVRGANRAVLRALADRYPNIYPAVTTLAKEAGYGTTRTRIALRELEALGIISPLTSRKGGRFQVQYAFNVNRLLELLAEQGTATKGDEAHGQQTGSTGVVDARKTQTTPTLPVGPPNAPCCPPQQSSLAYPNAPCCRTKKNELKKEKREEEEKGQLPSTFQKRLRSEKEDRPQSEQLTAFLDLAVDCTRGNVTFSDRQRASLGFMLVEFGIEDMTSAFRNFLDTRDDYTLKFVAKDFCGGQGEQMCRLARRQHKERLQNEQLAEKFKKEGREQAERELAEAQRKQEEEARLADEVGL